MNVFPMKNIYDYDSAGTQYISTYFKQGRR